MVHRAKAASGREPAFAARGLHTACRPEAADDERLV